MKHLFWTIVGSLCCATVGFAAKPSATIVSAELDNASLKAGGTATAIVVVEVADGLHAQSHTPTAKTFIPFTVTLTPLAGVAAGQAEYPVGEDKSYAALGKLNVYLGKVTVRVPLTIDANADAGQIELKGKVKLQACNDRACFPPETIPFTIRASIASDNATTQPSDTPATAPAAIAPIGGAGTSVFGIDLAHGGLPIALLAAGLVGIVFNAMPCVLPVMPLKIMGFYEASQHHRARSFQLGAVFSAGIVAFFLVLATLIVGLHTLAWGDLFRQTWFTLLIVIALTIVALGTFGAFSVVVPSRVYAFAPSHETYTGNFLFGVLTAMLSTPCTFGAFVALLTWTLAQPAWAGFALFTCVGIGMALPYLVLSAIPEVARSFPRTGRWSEVVKQLTAFLVLATAVFFAQPLISRYASAVAVWWTIFGIVAAAGVFLFVRSIQLSPRLVSRGIALAIAMLLIVPSFFFVRRLTSRPFAWQMFSQTALDDAISSGRPVLIDFTADWCNNCHWLEATVLHDPKVVSAVRDHDVLMLQADLTSEGAAGERLKNQLNPAQSIPVTAVYQPGEKQPRVLLDLYGVDDLLRAIEANLTRAVCNDSKSSTHRYGEMRTVLNALR